MRKVLSTLVALGFMTVLARAQTVQAPLQPTNWNEKILPDGVLKHDFGSVPKGGQFLYRFKLVNPWKPDITISTQVGCHCVTVTPSTLVLKAKEEGFLDISMDTRNFTGPKDVKITVTATWPGVGVRRLEMAPPVELHVSANIRADIVLNPGQINLGSITPSSAITSQPLDIEYAGALDWKITEVVPHTAPLDVTYKELYRRPGQIGYRVTVAVKRDAQPGSIKQEVFLRTNDPAGPLLPIPVAGTIQAGVSVAPGTLTVGPMKLGDEVSQKVFVRGGGQAVLITGIEGLGDGLTADIPPNAAPIQTVTFKYHAGKRGEVKRDVQIKTDRGTANITIEGAVEP